jgi:hypothetical protein
MTLLACILLFSSAAGAAVTVDLSAAAVPVHPSELEMSAGDVKLLPPSPNIGLGLGAELGFTKSYRSFVVVGLGGDRLWGTWSTPNDVVFRSANVDKARATVRWRFALWPMTGEPAAHFLTPFVEVGAGAELGWFHFEPDGPTIPPFLAPMLEAGAGTTLGTGRIRGFGVIRGRVDGSSSGARSIADCTATSEECFGYDFSPGGPAIALELGVLAL